MAIDKPTHGLGMTRPPGFVIMGDEDEDRQPNAGAKVVDKPKKRDRSKVKINRMVFFDAWMNEENKTVKDVAREASRAAGRSPHVSPQAMRARAKAFRENGVELPYKEDEIGAYAFFKKKLDQMQND